MTDDLKRLLPLPAGIPLASYVGDMREIAAYDIQSDTYLVRYDWIGEDNKQRTYFAKTIGYDEWDDMPAALAARRAEIT